MKQNSMIPSKIMKQNSVWACYFHLAVAGVDLTCSSSEFMKGCYDINYHGTMVVDRNPLSARAEAWFQAGPVPEPALGRSGIVFKISSGN